MSATVFGSIGIVGTGNMGAALVQGLVERVRVPADRIFVADADSGRVQDLVSRQKVKASDADRIAAECDVVIIAVKPGVVPVIAPSMAQVLAARAKRPTLVSVAAGVTVGDLRRLFPGQDRVVRIMPSLPCMVGAGVSGIYSDDPDAAQLGKGLVEAVGAAYVVSQEAHIDVVTALGASAPAFMYLVLEALADGAVNMGLPREIAGQMAAEMMRGAATLTIESGVHPAELKERVASPGGTTIAGLQVLEGRAVRGAFMDAIAAAVARARSPRP